MSQRDVFNGVPTYVLPKTTGALGDVLTVGASATPNTLVWAAGGSTTGIETINGVTSDAAGEFGLYAGTGIAINNSVPPNGLQIDNRAAATLVEFSSSVLPVTSAFSTTIYSSPALNIPQGLLVNTIINVTFSCYSPSAIQYISLQLWINSNFIQVIQIPIPGINLPVQCTGKFKVANVANLSTIFFIVETNLPNVINTTANDYCVVDIISYSSV